MEEMHNTDPTVADLPQYTITKALIEDCICGTGKEKRTHTVGFTFARFFGVLGVILMIVPHVGIMFLGLAVISFVLAKKSRHIVSEIQNLNYWIQEDVCLGKSTSDDPDIGTNEYLHLKHRGKVALGFPLERITQPPCRSWNLYDTTHCGDTVYLLCISPDKILYIFHSECWQVDENDFVYKENDGHPYYIPVRQKGCAE